MDTAEYGTGFFGTKKLTIYFMDILQQNMIVLWLLPC